MRYSNEPRRPTGPEAGQSMTEFAFILPVLIMLLLAGWGMGNLWRQAVAMNTAADAGAFYASLGQPAAAEETE